MKEYQVLIKNHELKAGPLWLTHYKVINANQFVTSLSESRYNAGCFDEDDYILELFKQKFKNIEFIEVNNKTIPLQKEENNELVL